MITGYLSLSVLLASLALCLSVLAGQPPLAWLLAYSGAGAVSLITLAFVGTFDWDVTTGTSDA